MLFLSFFHSQSFSFSLSLLLVQRLSLFLSFLLIPLSLSFSFSQCGFLFLSHFHLRHVVLYIFSLLLAMSFRRSHKLYLFTRSLSVSIAICLFLSLTLLLVVCFLFLFFLYFYLCYLFISISLLLITCYPSYFGLNRCMSPTLSLKFLVFSSSLLLTFSLAFICKVSFVFTRNMSFSFSLALICYVLFLSRIHYPLLCFYHISYVSFFSVGLIHCITFYFSVHLFSLNRNVFFSFSLSPYSVFLCHFRYLYIFLFIRFSLLIGLSLCLIFSLNLFFHFPHILTTFLFRTRSYSLYTFLIFSWSQSHLVLYFLRHTQLFRVFFLALSYYVSLLPSLFFIHVVPFSLSLVL